MPMARNALLRSSLVGERVWECGGRGRAICAEGRGNAEDEEDPFGWGKERSGWGAVVDEQIGWRGVFAFVGKLLCGAKVEADA